MDMYPYMLIVFCVIIALYAVCIYGFITHCIKEIEEGKVQPWGYNFFMGDDD